MNNVESFKITNEYALKGVYALLWVTGAANLAIFSAIVQLLLAKPNILICLILAGLAHAFIASFFSLILALITYIFGFFSSQHETFAQKSSLDGDVAKDEEHSAKNKKHRCFAVVSFFLSLLSLSIGFVFLAIPIFLLIRYTF